MCIVLRNPTQSSPFFVIACSLLLATVFGHAAESESKQQAGGDVEGSGTEVSREVEGVKPSAGKEAKTGESEVAVAKPVSGDRVRVYGWREKIQLIDAKQTLMAKLDTGALTSSIHAEDTKLFERDGKKWVRFFACDPTAEKPVRHKLEAPLVRIASIKDPGGKSEQREVVRLSFQIGERKLRGEFTLNDRHNMIAPVLLGRKILKELGWVDASRTDLADDRIFR